MNPSEYNRSVEQAFDAAAGGYDRPALRFFVNSARAFSAELPLRGHEILLDVATGTGNVALAVADHLPRGKVVGVDLSQGMLARAQSKIKNRKHQNIYFEKVEAERVGFPDGFFDGATCGFGVHFWPDMAAGVEHILTKVKPGGFFALSSFVKGSFEPLAGISLKLFEDYGVRMPKTYSLEKLDHPGKIKKLLSTVDLKNVRVTQKQVGYYLSSPQEWWDLILYTGYRAFLNKVSLRERKRYKRELLTKIASTASSKGVFLNVEVLFGIGHKR